MACAVSTEPAPCSNGTVKKPTENGHVTVERSNSADRRVPSMRVTEEGQGESPPRRNGHIRKWDSYRKAAPPPPPPLKHQMATIEEDDIRPPPSKCCCDQIAIQSACRFVAFLSLFAAIANAALYCFGLSRLGLSAPVEIIIMILDFIAAFCLLIGATNGSPSMLKPYLFFMTAWSFGLILLLLSCVWKLLTNRSFANNTIHNLMDLNRSGDIPRVRHARHGQEGFELLITAALVGGLALIIILDCLFLHVAYRAFQFFAYKKDRAKEGRAIV